VLRGLASKLRATREAIPFYRTMAAVRLAPPVGAIKEAATALIGWSNSLGDEKRDPETTYVKVARALKIRLDD
jgi:hypothetical protein